MTVQIAAVPIEFSMNIKYIYYNASYIFLVARR